MTMVKGSLLIFLKDFSRKVVEFYCVPVSLRLNLTISINRTFKINFIIVPINLALCFVRRRQVYESCTSGVLAAGQNWAQF